VLLSDASSGIILALVARMGRIWDRHRGIVLGAGLLVVTTVASCGDNPTRPTATTPLPFVSETTTTRYYYEPGDSVDVERQESFNAWAVRRLGLTVTRKIEYKKYTSRTAMGTYTGHYNTNGFAELALFTAHTLWPFENHGITDTVMAYREAGSFVLFLTDRFGLAAVLTFFQLTGNANPNSDSLAAIRSRFESVFGVSLEAAEAE
jgi:hypothetical protein